jgi:DNA-binding response OmpR family regulator
MTRPKILIAEDDDIVLDLVRIRLELTGYDTLYARNGHEALEKITSIVPDAVILDIGLPYRNGLDVLRTIRANMRTRAIPVLMLTARHKSEDVRGAIAAGAQDYLTKPFDDQKLPARVARLLKRPVSHTAV